MVVVTSMEVRKVRSREERKDMNIEKDQGEKKGNEVGIGKRCLILP